MKTRVNFPHLVCETTSNCQRIATTGWFQESAQLFFTGKH